MTEVRASSTGQGLCIGVVASRFNELVTDALLRGAQDALNGEGVRDEDVVLVRVPGALEIAYAANALARSGRVDAVVALGAVIRGETYHFEIVANESARAIADVALNTGVPVLDGILTTDTLEQALERAGAKAGNKGRDAARAAVEMANLGKALRAFGQRPDAKAR